MSETHFISGPLSWYHFEFMDDSGHQKTIHLFSDIHDLTNLCPKSFHCNQQKSKCKNMNIFLESVFQKSYERKEYLDFFLETPYRLSSNTQPQNQRITQSYLQKIDNRFGPCLSKKKRGCKYLPYVRMHYTDVRIPNYKYTTIGSLIVDMYYYFILAIKIQDDTELKMILQTIQEVIIFVCLNAYKISRILLTKENFDKKINRLFDPLIKKISKMAHRSNLIRRIKNRLQYKIKKMNSLYKIRNGRKVFIVKHQLDQLKKDNVRYNGILLSDYIMSFFDEYSRILSLRATQLNLEFWDSIYSGKMDLSRLEKDWSKVIEYNILFDLSYLDIYILARMFRDFPDKSSTALVYAGNLHIESQRDFFHLFLNLDPVHIETNKDGVRCLANLNFNSVFRL